MNAKALTTIDCHINGVSSSTDSIARNVTGGSITGRRLT